MAGRIKGITVEIGGDTTGLEKALKNVNSTIKNTQSQLKDVNRLLKLDPGNTELITQKQRALKDAIGATSEKLETLKQAQEQAKQQLENGEYLSSHKMMYVSTVPKFADGVGLRYVKKRTETKWQLTATLAEHAALLLSNLHVLGLLYIDPVTGEKKEWQFQVHEENIGAYISETEEPNPVHKFLSYDNQTLLEALNTLCSTENFDCEWWFEGGTLHFGRLEREEEGTLSLIQGLNAESISKDGSARSYCNRLFAFGSTQNISERYRKTFLPKINTVEEWNMDEIESKGYSFTEFYNLYSPPLGSTQPATLISSTSSSLYR